ncbi:hypothetical protein BC835DRAFT_698021 [Cytidiella melzeri]|nr:hypothetical protein BC835DRAFT_698021 [Cytidiella melzeri]
MDVVQQHCVSCIMCGRLCLRFGVTLTPCLFNLNYCAHTAILITDPEFRICANIVVGHPRGRSADVLLIAYMIMFPIYTLKVRV